MLAVAEFPPGQHGDLQLSDKDFLLCLSQGPQQLPLIVVLHRQYSTGDCCLILLQMLNHRLQEGETLQA